MAKKVFYSRVPGAMVYGADGTGYQFVGYPIASLELDTIADRAVITAVEGAIKASGGVMIFSDPASAPDMTASIDAMNAAVNAANAAVASAKVAGM